MLPTLCLTSPICRARIEHRIKQLTDVLMGELQVSPERSIRGGPRVARRAVTQLIRLGRSAQVKYNTVEPVLKDLPISPTETTCLERQVVSGVRFS